MEKAKKINPGISLGPVPVDKIDGVEGASRLASFSGVLGASPKLDPDVAYKVMKAIFDNVEEVRALGVQFEDIDLQFGVDYLVTGFPVHKGAARYLKEKGVWNDSLIEAS